jgi:uncharacterized protein (UPF0548 family)
MIALKAPTTPELQRFLSQQADAPYSYPEVGALRAGRMPAGYDHDCQQVQLGNGPDAYARACAAVRSWTMFRIGWVRTFPDNLPIEPGRLVAIVARWGGVWMVNACRIVDVVDEAGAVERFGFVYGTTAAHVERGEERFTVEWRHRDDSVWYDVRAFSTPNRWYARLGYPMVRRAQRRFAIDSKRAMVAAVNGA